MGNQQLFWKYEQQVVIFLTIISVLLTNNTSYSLPYDEVAANPQDINMELMKNCCVCAEDGQLIKRSTEFTGNTLQADKYRRLMEIGKRNDRRKDFYKRNNELFDNLLQLQKIRKMFNE